MNFPVFTDSDSSEDENKSHFGGLLKQQLRKMSVKGSG